MLLEIDNLCVDIQSDNETKRILDHVSLTIDSGQSVALVGESGSGKSVTALTVLRLFEGLAAAANSGKVLFEGENLLTTPESEIRHIRGNRIAMIFQEPMTSLNPVYAIGHQLLEPLMLHQGLTKKNAWTKGVELLSRTGIDDPVQRMQSYPHQLSGGQRQRIMIAMALACRPALLIADEPTTALDVTIQAQILDLIKDVQQDLDMSVLLITHDLNMVESFADQVHIMHDGRIVEHGNTKDVFEHPKVPYTIHLINSVPKGEPAPKEISKPLLEVKNLRCHFPIRAGFFKRQVGSIKAVDNVTFSIRKGSTFGVVGESGSGKTTLGMSILRLVNSTGTIMLNKQDLITLSQKEMRPLRRDVQVVFQDPYSSLSPRLSVEQIISEGLVVHGIGQSQKERRLLVQNVLEEVGLEPEMAGRYPHEFSGGQRQRIAIARAVILEPRFLVLDEPTSALDMTIQDQIIRLLRKLQETHRMTYLFISHDLRVVRALADEIAVMKNGEIIETGSAHQIFSAPQHPYTQKLFAAAFELRSGN